MVIVGVGIWVEDEVIAVSPELESAPYRWDQSRHRIAGIGVAPYCRNQSWRWSLDFAELLIGGDLQLRYRIMLFFFRSGNLRLLLKGNIFLSLYPNFGLWLYF